MTSRTSSVVSHICKHVEIHKVEQEQSVQVYDYEKRRSSIEINWKPTFSHLCVYTSAHRFCSVLCVDVPSIRMCIYVYL